MPKFTKCWYKNCDSDNRENPGLLFYKFPKDFERCEQWINNCNNDELSNIWKTLPERVGTFRICQKHFLKEFLGSSSRLVGHAVPAPYGVSLDCMDTKKFMVECAVLKSSSTSSHQVRQKFQLNGASSPEGLHPVSISCETITPPLIDNNNIASPDDTYRDETSLINSSNNEFETQPPTTTLIMKVDHDTSYNHPLTVDPLKHSSGDSLIYATSFDPSESYIVQQILPSTCGQQQTCNSNTNQITLSSISTTAHLSTQQVVSGSIECNNSTSVLNQGKSINTTTISIDRKHNGNPKINYDREGKVISIQYPNQTLSMTNNTDDKAQHQVHVDALKQKLRHYQRKLAVINHRYQKLRSQMKGRSNKMRLLESLKICKADFDPCVFEIFKRQIKGPSSKHGNRWSNEVKLFSSSIYIRSRPAYKFIRKTIDLPSESIVKRFIGEKRLSQLPSGGLDNNDAEEEEDDEDGGGDREDGHGHGEEVKSDCLENRVVELTSNDVVISVKDNNVAEDQQ